MSAVKPSRFSGRARAFAGPVLAAAAAVVFILAPAEAETPPKWAGSRTPAVHRIPLNDEFGQKIIPSEPNPLPFSARTTCAPCHDYETVKTGRHFNAASPDAPAGRPGEPWIWLDERTGTQIPLSERSWKGVFKPADLGLSSWDLTLLFGRHFPGGGPAEPEPEDETPDSRWSVSGKAEINCLGCHSASGIQNHSEWAKQILRENLRWAATAASGLGEVGGIASRLAGTWDIADGPNPDDSEWAVAPFVKYDRALFDSKHQAFLDIAYPPRDSSCLACHSAAPAGSRKFDYEGDVHGQAGLACASCHRNDLSHRMIRGYEGEAEDDPALLSADFTCAACHLGREKDQNDPPLPGRMGAPYPLHKGLPEVHIERLACTVCHSGPLPEKEAVRVRTARANRLGIFGIADWSTDLPAIVEPVYLRDARGKLTPHRMMWPAYWGVKEGGKKTGPVRPLRPAEVEAAAGDILYPDRTAVRILAALQNASGLTGKAVLFAGGKIYEPNLDGGLTAVVPEAGTAVPAGDGFAALENGLLTPFVPDFNPADSETAAEAEGAIQTALEALLLTEAAPGEPALRFKGFLYRLVDGFLDKMENAEAAGTGPEWLWASGETFRPMLSETDKNAVLTLTGTDRRLTETQVSLVLEALARGGRANAVYVSGGKLFRLDKKNRLEVLDDPAADPVAWPVAHEVRPARQALGWNGCTDCHSLSSKFFFARVDGQGPLRTEKISRRPASSYMGVDNLYHRLFGLSYAGRPYFKILLGAAALVIGAVLLAALVLAAGRLSGLIEKRK